MFNATIEDNNDLSHYIFSMKNSSTAEWDNYTAVFIGGRRTTYFANVSRNITTTEGEVLQWRYYANDTEGNMYASQIVTKLVGDSDPPEIGLDSPRNNSKQTNQTIMFKYIPNDKNLDSCILYHNASGSFAANTTNRTSEGMINATQLNITFNFTDGFYLW